jgi:hypothetical protein
MYQDHALDRVPVRGKFRYLCGEGPLQREQREGALGGAGPSPQAPLSTQAAVLVLVDYIKTPELSFEQLAARLQAQGHGASAESIGHFFADHGLKKTPAHSAPNS